MIDLFVSEIKKKKILSSLPDLFVRKLVVSFLDEHPPLKKSLGRHNKPLKSKDFRLLLKGIRKTLHDIYGVFTLKERELNYLRNHLRNLHKLDEEAFRIHLEILSTHKSSLERIDYYHEVYETIFSFTGSPESIVDLACGLNPLSFPWMGLKKVDYFAFEISPSDCDFLNEYFKIMKPFGLNGKAFAVDLLDLKEIPKADVCFLFKVLDSLEDLQRNYSEKLLKRIPCKFIVVSFPTMSLGGKNPIKQRGWFFRMMRNLGYSAKTFEIENEIFYIVKK